MPVLIQIGLGGALGALLRYAVVSLSLRLFGASFPWGTFAVNVFGSFAMGLAYVLVLTRGEPGLQRHAAFFMPGVLGGFTTFSAFSLETIQLIERGRAVAAIGYVAASVGLCLLAVVAGARIAEAWIRP